MLNNLSCGINSTQLSGKYLNVIKIGILALFIVIDISISIRKFIELSICLKQFILRYKKNIILMSLYIF